MHGNFGSVSHGRQGPESTQKAQYRLIKEYTVNPIKDPKCDLRYMPYLRDIGLSGNAIGLG